MLKQNWMQASERGAGDRACRWGLPAITHVTIEPQGQRAAARLEGCVVLGPVGGLVAPWGWGTLHSWGWSVPAGGGFVLAHKVHMRCRHIGPLCLLCRYLNFPRTRLLLEQQKTSKYWFKNKTAIPPNIHPITSNSARASLKFS